MNENRGRRTSRPTNPPPFSRPSRSAQSGVPPSQQDPSSPAFMRNADTLNLENSQNIMNSPTATGAGGVAVNIINMMSGDRGGQRNTETLPDEVVFYSSPRADHEIYYYQLLTKGRGSPLFGPGPGRRLPFEYRKQGIGLGDVGIVTRLGKFDFLFNIFQPANSPINIRGVPPSFSPLSEQDHEVDDGKMYGRNTYLTSSSVLTSVINSSDLRFESTAQEAAILTMPEGASTHDLRNKIPIKTCIEENARCWYEYITGPRGRIIEPGELLGVVVGWDKVRSWGIATSTCTSGQAAMLEFKADESGAPQAYRWDCIGVASPRVGPEEEEISDLRQQNGVAPCNQSVFIRTINFTEAGVVPDNPTTSVQPDVPVSGRGEPWGPPTTHSTSSRRGSRAQGSSRGQSGFSGRRGSHFYQAMTASRTPGIVHPATWLHEHLLEMRPNATLVITEDADWMSVLTDEDIVFPEPEELVTRILGSYDVHENAGTVTIQKKAVELPPKVEQHASSLSSTAIKSLAFDAATPDLPSTVEETLSSCPQIRIAVIGSSGVGKSTLVQRIFNIDPKEIDIAHYRSGRANIERGYTSQENGRFILHDSEGFEAGSVDQWHPVEKFLRDRSKMENRDRVHAIWHCVLSPCDGVRLQQTGDEMLLKLAQELNIPVILVITKYDELVKEQRIKALKRGGKKKLSNDEAENAANTCFNERITYFQWPPGMEASTVRISSSPEYRRSFETLLELTNVTRKRLGDEEDGGVVPWVIAQRISASQKVEFSIRQGFKKYWINLGHSMVFQGRKVNQCLWRIHDDILKIWNFNDPEKLLSGQEFFADMILLVEPMVPDSEAEIHQDEIFSKCLDLAATASAANSTFAFFLITAGIGLFALKFLYGTHKKIPLSAHYLGAYITDLICVLHLLFQESTGSGQPKELSQQLISNVIQQYKNNESLKIHNRIREIGVLSGFEEKIATLVREETNTLDGRVDSGGKARPVWKRLFKKDP